MVFARWRRKVFSPLFLLTQPAMLEFLGALEHLWVNRFCAERSRDRARKGVRSAADETPRGECVSSDSVRRPCHTFEKQPDRGEFRQLTRVPRAAQAVHH